MRECGEDLLVDLSEILFNELAFFRLMQDLDDPKAKVKAKLRQWKDPDHVSLKFAHSQDLVCNLRYRLIDIESYELFLFYFMFFTLQSLFIVYILLEQESQTSTETAPTQEDLDNMDNETNNESHDLETEDDKDSEEESSEEEIDDEESDVEDSEAEKQDRAEKEEMELEDEEELGKVNCVLPLSFRVATWLIKKFDGL